MPQLDSDEQLKSAIDDILDASSRAADFQPWVERLERYLASVRQQVPERLGDPDFIRLLLDDPTISATSQGSIDISDALSDADFCQWFKSAFSKPVPLDAAGRTFALTTLFNELRSRLKVFTRGTPHLKVSRAMCALFPDDFTSIASISKLRELYAAMGGTREEHSVSVHAAIRKRIDPFIPALDGEAPTHLQARRLRMSWKLLESLKRSDLDETPSGKKIPGLTPIGGRVQTLLRVLPQLVGGVDANQFDALLQAGSEKPFKKNTLAIMRRVISKELDLCVQRGKEYSLSSRGQKFLETKDPDVLKDHLIERVFGVDHVLKALSEGEQSRTQLIAMLKRAYPRWTEDFIPQALLSWLMSFDVIESVDRSIRLTDRGRRWAEEVEWEPAAEGPGVLPIMPIEEDVQRAAFVQPSLSDVWARMEERSPEGFTFDKETICQLHAGLWGHPSRHFAVLTGISGSGKTQLALNYALALCEEDASESEHVIVVPVQPGWFDPAPLLGHVSVIRESSYRRAQFLNLLLAAADNPSRPYVAILDEMNLSHPEQYLAPVLSTMETGSWIPLHDMDADSGGVPAAVRYPSNLVIIGTVNMDETTHGLSDKVLDRAFTMEFMQSPVAEHPIWNTELVEPIRTMALTTLVELEAALSPCRLNFGRRTVNDVVGYLKARTWTPETASSVLDEVVYARILPKIRGESTERFQRALDGALETVRRQGLLRCIAKLESLKADLAESGSARFWR